jgi:hypothetical protein
MARQKTKLSEKFASGGDKDGSPEEKFFTDVDIQIDPEWKVIELLRSQIDDITDTVNANDAGSGSFASNIKTLTSAVSTNTSKTGITSTQASRITANHAKVGISTVQAATVNNLHLEGGALIPTTTANHTVSLSVTNSRGAYALVFTMVDGSGETPVKKTAKVNLS